MTLVEDIIDSVQSCRENRVILKSPAVSTGVQKSDLPHFSWIGGTLDKWPPYRSDVLNHHL